MTMRSVLLLASFGVLACASAYSASSASSEVCDLSHLQRSVPLDSLAGEYLLKITASTGPSAGSAVDVPLTLVLYPGEWRYGTPRFLRLADTADPRGGALPVFDWDSIVGWDNLYRPEPRRLYGWSTAAVGRIGITTFAHISSRLAGAPGVLLTRDSVLTLSPPGMGGPNEISNAAHARLKVLRATSSGFAGEWAQEAPTRGGVPRSGTFCAIRRAV